MDPLLKHAIDAYAEGRELPTSADYEAMVDRLFPLVTAGSPHRWVDHAAILAAMHRGTCSVAFASIEARSTPEDRARTLGRMVGKAPPLFDIPKVYDLPLAPTLARIWNLT